MGIAGFVLMLGLSRIVYSVVLALIFFLIAKYKLIVRFVKVYRIDWDTAVKRLKYKSASALVK